MDTHKFMLMEPMPTNRDPKEKLNQQWLRRHLELNKISQRYLAKQLQVLPSAITKMVKGERRLQMDEALELARLFRVPLDEVLTQAGIDVRVSSSKDMVEVSGSLDETLTVRLGEALGPKRVANPLPPNERNGVCVLRVQTAGSHFDGIDGALVYYRPQAGVVHPDAVGRLCIVTVGQDSSHPGERSMLRVVKRGYQAGYVNLTSLDGRPMEAEVKLLEAWPVIWMKL
jgi:plasmid maintenance system antidote protein VapI